MVATSVGSQRSAARRPPGTVLDTHRTRSPIAKEKLLHWIDVIDVTATGGRNLSGGPRKQVVVAAKTYPIASRDLKSAQTICKPELTATRTIPVGGQLCWPYVAKSYQHAALFRVRRARPVWKHVCGTTEDYQQS